MIMSRWMKASSILKLAIFSLILIPVLSFGTGMEFGGTVILMENASKVIQGWTHE
jgi:hypothetical protein